jgi:hypothetical protein
MQFSGTIDLIDDQLREMKWWRLSRIVAIFKSIFEFLIVLLNFLNSRYRKYWSQILVKNTSRYPEGWYAQCMIELQNTYFVIFALFCAQRCIFSWQTILTNRVAEYFLPFETFSVVLMRLFFWPRAFSYQHKIIKITLKERYVRLLSTVNRLKHENATCWLDSALPH